MTDQHFPDGYNVLTGEETNGHANDKYGEIHTGDAWQPSRDRYCKNQNDMPVALIVFADKSHTDLHGALSLTPIIFTLTLFNRSARNNPNFWRPMGYIPNLVYGKGTSDKTRAKDKIQDEHRCLSFIFGSLKEISKQNDSCVMYWEGLLMLKYGYISSSVIQKAIISCLVNFQEIKRGSNVHIVIASVHLMI
jgi:hypothetical protein